MRDAAALYVDRYEDGGIADAADSGFRYRFWPYPATIRLRWMLCDASFPRIVGGARPNSLVGESALDQIQVHTRRTRRILSGVSNRLWKMSAPMRRSGSSR